MEFGSLEYQLAVWNIFSLGKISGAMVTIGSILAIWLAMRIAVATRNSTETNMFAKIVSSAFGIIVVLFSFIQYTENTATYTNTAATFERIKAAGFEVSPATDNFIEYVRTVVGNVDVPSYPGALATLFLITVLLIILGQIWYPKKD